MAYKNIFPFDFVNLQNGEGFLGHLINIYKDELDEEITEYKEKLDSLNKLRKEDIAENEAELLLLWSKKYNLKVKKGYGYSFDNIDSLIESRNVIENNLEVNIENKRLRYDEFKQENKAYKIKLEYIEHSDDRIDDVKNKISELRNKKISSINKEIISEAFNKFIEDSSDKKLDNTTIVKNQKKLEDFVYLMIKNNFINEDYLDVINNYYGNPKHKIFIRDIMLDNEVKNYDLSLKPIGEDLLLDLHQLDNVFSKKQTLNYDLAEYLMNNDNLSSFIELIKTSDKLNDGFKENFVDKSDEIYKYLIEKIPGIKFNLVNNTKTSIEVNNKEFSSIFNHFDDIFKNERFEYNKENTNKITEWFNLKYNLIDSIKLIQEYMEVNKNENIIIDIVKHLGIINLDENIKENKADVNDIDSDRLLCLFMNNNKIKPTSSNLSSYFSKHEYEINDTLVKFINENEFLFDTDLSEKFYTEFCDNDGIKDDKYKYFMELYKKNKHKKINVSDLSGLSNDKVAILFDLDILENNLEYISYINDNDISVNKIHADYKQIILDNKIELNNTLLNIILRDASGENSIIMSRNLNKLNINQVLNYLYKLSGEDSKRFINLIENGKVRNKGFTNNEFVSNLVQYLKDNGIIYGFTEQHDKKIKIIK